MRSNERTALYRFWTPNFWHLWILLGLLRLICMLPHRARLALGFAIGRATHRLSAERRAVTRRNIELCFPDLDREQRNALARAHFEALGASIVELGMCRWSSDAEIAALTSIEGAEHVTRHTDKGTGVILVSAHFTILELSGRTLCKNVPPFDVVFRKHRNPFVTEFLRETRLRFARQAIDKNDIRRMVRSLRDGGIVWYAPDQSYSGKQSSLVPFFGVPAMTNTAMSTLGKLGRAVAVPYFPRRLDDGSYVISIMPAIDGFPGDDADRDAETYYRIIEERIRQYPEQYYWIHRKFKKRPAPLPDAYANLESLR